MMFVNTLNEKLLVTAAFSSYEGVLTISPSASSVDGNRFENETKPMNDLKAGFSVTPAWSVFNSCTSLKAQMTGLNSKVRQSSPPDVCLSKVLSCHH